MDEPQIILAALAEADLEELGRYIAARDGLARANSVLGRLGKTIHSLAFMPRMGRPRSYLPPGAYAFSSRPWTIVYEPLGHDSGIRILRVIDGRRDFSALFRGS